MPIYETSLLVPRPVGQVFPFFANAHNLERLTPSWLRFHVLTPAPIEMRVGSLIDYRLHVRGIPLHWQSEITVWEPPHRFVDEQRKGPYRRWRHEHRFEDRGRDTLVIDHVDYSVFGGALVDRLLVRRDIQRIFDFRRRAMKAIFGVSSGDELGQG